MSIISGEKKMTLLIDAAGNDNLTFVVASVILKQFELFVLHKDLCCSSVCKASLDICRKKKD